MSLDEILFSFPLKAKAFDKKTSVLQYLVKLVKHNDESLLKVKEDLTFIERAQNLPIDSISYEVSIIADELKRITDVASKYGDFSRSQNIVSPASNNDGNNGGQKSTNPDDIQHTSIETFVNSAATEIHRISLSMDTLKRNYSSLLEYFGEDPNKKSSEFFGTLSKFLVTLQGAMLFVENQEKAKVNLFFYFLYN
jgi:hypothetical protein